MKNIANVFIKMGQYTDASTTYEHIMQDRPDIETGIWYSDFRIDIVDSSLLL